MNRATVELGFILKQIPSFDFSMTWFDNRLKLQKTIYLLQAFGIYFGYDFSWYLRGPYCSLLATNGFELESIYARIPDDKKTGFQNSTAQEKFTRFLRFVKGKDTSELEIAASLHRLKKQSELGEDEIKKKVENKQKHFTEGQINNVWRNMQECDMV